jgi:hypothetical protein
LSAAALGPAPDLIEPVVGFRSWRTLDGYISSPYVPVRWRDPVMHATCRPGVISRGEWLTEPHRAPHPDCRCGIYAYHSPQCRFAAIDFRNIPGIVTLWGRIEVHRGGMRAEHARIHALAFFRGWGGRQCRAARQVADNLGVDLVDWAEIGAAAREYGRSLPRAMMPQEPPVIAPAPWWSRWLAG